MNALALARCRRNNAHMRWSKDTLVQTEKRAAAVGLTVPELLRLADVHKATWARWKRGTCMPRLSLWDRIEQIIEGRAQRLQIEKEAA